MAHNSLAMYNVLVKKNRGAVGHTDLGNIEGADFYDLVQGFCRDLKTLGMQTDDSIKRSFSVEKLNFDSEARWIYGQLSKGEYGTKKTVYSTVTREASKQIEADEVVPEPFYFGFYLPRTEPRGFLLLQRIGAIGVMSDFKKAMKKNIDRTVLPKHHFDLPAAISERVINELYANGRISKIKLTRYTTSGDEFEDMSPMEITQEFTIKPTGRGRALPLNRALQRTRQRGRTVSDLIGLSSLNFDYEEATAEIYGLGKKWTVYLNDPSEHMLPYYEIDSNVTLDANGYPAIDSVHERAKELVNDHIQGEEEQ